MAEDPASSPSEAAAGPAGDTHPGLMAALGVAVYTTDAEGRLTSYNDAAAALWGWRPPLGDARWCGSWRLFRLDGTPMPHAECPMAVTLREGRPVHGAEAVAERPDGTRVPFIPHPTPLRDAAGAVVGAVNVLVDITDRKAAEAELAANAARLRAVFETTSECIKLVAPDGTLLQMNAAGLRMIEAASPAEAEGRSVLDLIAPEHRAAWRAMHDRVCRGEALRWEFDIIGLRGRRLRMETDATPLLLPDGQRAQLAITRDVSARRQAEERQAMLALEVDHRAKNALQVALSLVRLTQVEDPRRFAAAVEGRIGALAHAHTLLAEEGWSGAALRAVAEAGLTRYVLAGRAQLHGPAIWLVPGAVQPLSMALHEMAANAARFGALSTRSGQVEVTWAAIPATGGLALRWVESGGPRVEAPPPRRGFGLKLLEATARDQLGGAVRLHWEPDGLRCEMTIAADRLLPGRAAAAEEAAAAENTAGAPGPAGRRVLLVEDELLVAMELEETLRRLGCEVVGPAATVEEALRLAQAAAGRIDAAVLDVNLAGRPSFPVADALKGQGVPVVFATAYGDLPDGRATGGGSSLLLRKPFGPGELEAALSRVLAALAAGGHGAAAARRLGGHPGSRGG